MPIQAFDPPCTTTQANVVSGGTALTSWPARRLVTWECRPLPGRDGTAVVERAKELAASLILPKYRKGAPDADIVSTVMTNYPGLALNMSSPAIALALAVTGANHAETVAYGTEAGHFASAGIPAVICGPGSIDQAHKADEFVALSELDACEKFLRKVVEKACN